MRWLSSCCGQEYRSSGSLRIMNDNVYNSNALKISHDNRNALPSYGQLRMVSSVNGTRPESRDRHLHGRKRTEQ